MRDSMRFGRTPESDPIYKGQPDDFVHPDLRPMLLRMNYLELVGALSKRKPWRCGLLRGYWLADRVLEAARNSSCDWTPRMSIDWKPEQPAPIPGRDVPL